MSQPKTFNGDQKIKLIQIINDDTVEAVVEDPRGIRRA